MITKFNAKVNLQRLFVALWLIIPLIFLMPFVVQAEEITSPFGWRINPLTGAEEFHTGIDVAYEYGTPIGAVLPGKIIYAAEYGGYGNCVILEHADGNYTLYAHLSSIAARYLSSIAKGDIIGYVGSTGVSTGPHLHLEWWYNGEYRDPVELWQRINYE